MPINIDGSKGIRQNTTEVTKIPVGTTAQRPANPEAGMMRFNTDEGYVEWYDDFGDRWIATSSFPGVVASGGTVTDITQGGRLFRVHTFTSDGTFDVARGGEVEYLVVAGGGSGGASITSSSAGGGGGGAGGVVSKASSVAAGSNPVTVGAGGIFDTDTSRGQNGADSSAFGVIALGGGSAGRAGDESFGLDGGSGGGASENGSRTGPGGSGLQPGSPSGGFGNDGGDVDGRSGGGGGGANEAGTNGSESSSAGSGGDGIFVGDIFTTALGEDGFFGGGGGGTNFNSSNFGTGGIGGGADGSPYSSFTTNSGMPNTGGGGGGGASAGRVPGNGGSGIVIVRYRIG